VRRKKPGEKSQSREIIYLFCGENERNAQQVELEKMIYGGGERLSSE
jgi:hypothetical protein